MDSNQLRYFFTIEYGNAEHHLRLFHSVYYKKRDNAQYDLSNQILKLNACGYEIRECSVRSCLYTQLVKEVD